MATVFPFKLLPMGSVKSADDGESESQGVERINLFECDEESLKEFIKHVKGIPQNPHWRLGEKFDQFELPVYEHIDDFAGDERGVRHKIPLQKLLRRWIIREIFRGSSRRSVSAPDLSSLYKEWRNSEGRTEYLQHKRTASIDSISRSLQSLNLDDDSEAYDDFDKLCDEHRDFLIF